METDDKQKTVSKIFSADDIVKTCPKLVSGLNLAVNGLRACTRGAFMPPLFCTIDDINNGFVTKEFIINKRKDYIRMLNDNHSAIDCKHCMMVEHKRYGDICFSKLGHIDLQHYSICNLGCSYCLYVQTNANQHPPQYDALSILRLFAPEDIEWNAHVDFAGGEPTMLHNLDECLKYFRDMRIRVLMFTNAVLFSQSIYDGLADGSIYWTVTSLDAGTPSSFNSLRGRDKYLTVLENLCRYAAAGSKGKGMLAVKYIFCESNCSDDDIAGFAYAMLAIRPQKIWLNIDFSNMYKHRNIDYTKQIQAYAKLYLLLKKHGIEAFHYFEEALARFVPEAKSIMDSIYSSIEDQASTAMFCNNELYIGNFREDTPIDISDLNKFSINPLMLKAENKEPTSLSLKGKYILLAPASTQTLELLNNPEIKQADRIGFLDRNPILHGKKINDVYEIYDYSSIKSLKPDIVLVITTKKHRVDILNAIKRNVPYNVQIIEYEGY